VIFDSNCNYAYCTKERLTIVPEMDHKEWLKTFARTLAQQIFTSPNPRMIALCRVNLGNDSIKIVLCAT
jgi:hypothetical protein